MRDLTLRQIEVIRAVMMTGTINGAAALLGVSAPGISRLLKHTEGSLGVRLFERKGGAFVPAAEAQPVFDQVQRVFEQVENLGDAVSRLRSGADAELAFASVPSIAQFMASRAIRRVRRKHPDLYIDLNIVKIEEAVDYLLLERGEFVATSFSFDHPMLEFERLAKGVLVAIVPDEHPLASRRTVSVAELAREPMIGVDPRDPYGAIVSRPLREQGLDLRHSIRVRFAQSVVSLVRHGLGVALIDEFSVAEVYMPGLTRLGLEEETSVEIHVARKKGRAQSSFALLAKECLRAELADATAGRPWEA